MASAKFLRLLRDFVPEYHHAKFGSNLTTNKGETEGGGTYMVPKHPSLNRVNLSSWGKANLIDDQPRGTTNKQSGYNVNVHERAEKIVEGIFDEFCLFFSSIKAVSLQLGRGVAK